MQWNYWSRLKDDEMKWIANSLLATSWILTAGGLAIWLLFSMFNDSPSSAAAFQKIINSWLNLAVVAIVVTIVFFLVKEPKLRLAISSLGALISLTIFIHPFLQIQERAEAYKKEADNANVTLLAEVRTKIEAGNQLAPEDAEATRKLLFSLVDSQGEAALNVLRLGLKNGALPLNHWERDVKVSYFGDESKQGDKPQINGIVASSPSILKVYLDAGAETNVADTAFRLTPLMHAARFQASPNGLEIIRLLLKSGCPKNAKDAFGKTAYDFALLAKEDVKQNLEYLPPTDSRYKRTRLAEIEASLKIADEIIGLLKP